jgi:hypothetical protein
MSAWSSQGAAGVADKRAAGGRLELVADRRREYIGLAKGSEASMAVAE